MDELILKAVIRFFYIFIILNKAFKNLFLYYNQKGV